MKRSKLMLVCCAAALAVCLASLVCRGGDDSDCSVSVVAYPADGAAGVPLNTILVGPSGLNDYYSPSTFLVLLDSNGNEVATEVATSYSYGTCNFYWHRPVSKLLPNSSYTMIAHDEGTEEYIFTTSGSEDLKAPEIEVGDDSVDGTDYLRTYSSNEELVLMTYETTLYMGTIGNAVSTELKDTVDGYSSTTFYDRAGNSTVVEAWIDQGDDCDCAIVGAGIAERGWLIELLVVLAR